MTNLLDQLSTWLVDHNLTGLLFVVLVFVTFAEAGLFFGFVLPGETALLLGGALTATGALPFWPFLVTAVVAAAAGDSLGYGVGHRYGSRVAGSRLGRRVGSKRWAAAGDFLGRNGGKSVFLARGQALLRALVPFLAGQARMPYGVFFRWNLAGAVVWAGGVVVLGHLFARSVSVLERVFGWFGLAVLVALVAALVVRHRRRAHLAPDAAGPGG
ncbi:MAG: DedA family protein [Actinomycetota bacterium]|nr:DedA family protein [Actinomycetota bacterium]MDH4352632.1 DedA family protein [Actinomycetota bacterium]MDH5278898.1 DedA family protein [Actinomycetota bacterium]